MPYQKQAFTSVITHKLSHAGLCILTLLLWCATPSSPASLATGVNSSSTHADQREALLPLATQSHSLRIRSSKTLTAETNDGETDDAALPAYAAQVVLARSGSCALSRSITPRADNLSRCLPPSRAPPAA
ncbi:hypothetical protein ACT3OH_12445 [Vreelandella zhanjiangensis]|uniref:hypothetical protein n=1 Tax=Vreelandella zhanjiangensis TaxID=1121960 RepID=UPI00402ADD2B